MQHLKRLKVILIGLMVGLFFVGIPWQFQVEAKSDEASFKKRKRVGAVSVEAVYLNPLEKVKAGELRFEVTMNTHSVDLDAYNMVKISLIRNDQGMVISAHAWDKPSGDGHHRSGILIFSSKDSSSSPLITPTTKYIELVIKGVAGKKETVFRWDLN